MKSNSRLDSEIPTTGGSKYRANQEDFLEEHRAHREKSRSRAASNASPTKQQESLGEHPAYRERSPSRRESTPSPTKQEEYQSEYPSFREKHHLRFGSNTSPPKLQNYLREQQEYMNKYPVIHEGSREADASHARDYTLRKQSGNVSTLPTHANVHIQGYKNVKTPEHAGLSDGSVSD